jgi:4-amino-4-deoxy-L-arabinose transferase-like glycosyltransferase
MKDFIIRNKYSFLFSVIIILAAFLRLFDLDKIPGSFIPDELALGYTSFSLLKTGADIHGNFFPISFSIFGAAWTLIGYPLMDFIPQIFLGLSEWSVRLPSAIAGIAGTVLIYFIADIVFFKNKKVNLLAALVFSISPWNVFLSRLGLEYSLALSVFLLGLLCFLKFIYVSNKKESLLMASVIIFSLTEIIYYPYVIFIPIFLISLFILFKSKIIKSRRFLWVLAFFVLSNLLIYLIIFSTSIGESSSQSIFNDKGVIYNRVEKFRTDKSNEPILLQRIIHNKYLGVPYQMAQNYVNTFSPDFLFDKGGDKIERDIGYFGKLYLIDALFLLIGFAGLFYKKEKNIWFLCIWLITAPIASSVTKDSPSTSRLFMIMPIFTLVIAYGMYQFLGLLKGGLIKKLFFILVSGLFLVNFIFFIDAYFAHFNYQRVRFLHFGYKQVVGLTQKYPNYKVVMRGADNSPYIYFLFYTKYDPKKFIKEVKYYPPTNEGFEFVNTFGRYSFPNDIDYTKLQHKTIYIDYYEQGNLAKDKMDKIYLPSGEPILVYNIIN